MLLSRFIDYKRLVDLTSQINALIIIAIPIFITLIKFSSRKIGVDIFTNDLFVFLPFVYNFILFAVLAIKKGKI